MEAVAVAVAVDPRILKIRAWSLDPELDFCSSESTSSKKKTLGDPAVECLLHSLRLDVHGGNETRMIQT